MHFNEKEEMIFTTKKVTGSFCETTSCKLQAKSANGTNLHPTTKVTWWWDGIIRAKIEYENIEEQAKSKIK